MGTNNKPVMLLVEDEQDTADLVSLIMKDRGYQVSHAPDGAAALEKIALMPPLFLAMVDIQLPMSTVSQFWRRSAPHRTARTCRSSC
jgi:CheY-like chemotaxis protein